MNQLLIKVFCITMLIARITNSHAAKLKRKVMKVGPPQLIYRIDQECYLMLERYTNCNYGSVYYYRQNQTEYKY